MRFQVLALAIAGLALTDTARAQCGQHQLTSPPNFVSNNGGVVGGMVFFSLDVLPQAGVAVCGISLNTGTAASLPIRGKIYRHRTITDWNLLTAANNQRADWCLLGRLAGTSAGPGAASAMTVANATNSLELPRGQYLLGVGDGDFDHRYTTGNVLNQHITDGRLAFDGGAAANAIYSASLFQPRVVNCALHYDVASTPAVLTACSVEATCAEVGVGCGGTGGMVYELFDAQNAWDLSTPPLNAVLFSGSGGVVQTAAALGLPFVPPTAPDLALGDDAASPLIDLGFTLDAFGVCSREISVCSNGSIFLGGIGDTAWTESAATMNLDPVPRVAAYWNDLQPVSGGGASGTIHVDQGLGWATVTFDRVALWGSATDFVTFQVYLSPSLIRISYDPASPFQSSALVGFADGTRLGVVPPPSNLNGGAVAAVAGRANLSLSCRSLPVVGTAFDLTLSGIPTIGGVLADFSFVGAGTPLPTPLFAAGCNQYIGNTYVVLGLGTTCVRQLSIALPAGAAFVGLPIVLQGAALDGPASRFSTSNAIQSRVGNL